MVVVTGSTGNVGRRIASCLPRMGGVVYYPEPRTTDPAASRIAAAPGA